MSNENTTTRLTDTTSRMRFTVRADGLMVMPFIAESGNAYTLSGRNADGSDISCNCKGFEVHGHCYHTVQARHRLAGEDVPSRDEVRAARRTARKVGGRPRRVSARRAIVEPVIETAPAPTKKKRPSARRIH